MGAALPNRAGHQVGMAAVLIDRLKALAGRVAALRPVVEAAAARAVVPPSLPPPPPPPPASAPSAAASGVALPSSTPAAGVPQQAMALMPRRVAESSTDALYVRASFCLASRLVLTLDSCPPPPCAAPWSPAFERLHTWWSSCPRRCVVSFLICVTAAPVCHPTASLPSRSLLPNKSWYRACMQWRKKRG